MAERKVPLTFSRSYTFTGTWLDATAEAQRVGKRDFDWFSHIAVDIQTPAPDADGDASTDWVITISNGKDGYLKMPTDYPAGSRPDPYTSDGNEYDGI